MSAEEDRVLSGEEEVVIEVQHLFKVFGAKPEEAFP